jgi:hypothetical protein
MNFLLIGIRPRPLVRQSLAMFLAVTALATAQASTFPYQYCEPKSPAINAAHRVDTNYRYAPEASIRSLQGLASYRCEAAWTQSPADIDTLAVCPQQPVGCSADANNSCQDGGENWEDVVFLGARLW